MRSPFSVRLAPMTRVVPPLLQFTGLTKAEVMTALNDPDPGNPIAVEVARLIEGYAENFAPMSNVLVTFPTVSCM